MINYENIRDIIYEMFRNEDLKLSINIDKKHGYLIDPDYDIVTISINDKDGNCLTSDTFETNE